MFSPKIVAAATCLLAVLPAAAAAQAVAKAPRPEQLRTLVACRLVADAAERLSCFDREAAAFDAAEARSDIVVVDRQQLRTTRRSLFGLSLPRIPFLDDEKEKIPVEFEAAIRSVQPTRDGKWILSLDEATWRTTETSNYMDDPRPGDQIKIRRGPLGSYIATINGQRPVKAMRVR